MFSAPNSHENKSYAGFRGAPFSHLFPLAKIVALLFLFYELELISKKAWADTCTTYQNGCDESGECMTDYDEREEIIMGELVKCSIA